MIRNLFCIGKDSAPSLGDIRALGISCEIGILPGAETRGDWPRYIDAIGVAITRGADVRWVR